MAKGSIGYPPSSGGGGGSGDVVGPSSSTDNAVARFDSTTGKLLQDSVVTISDTGRIVAPGGMYSGGLGGILIDPDGGLQTDLIDEATSGHGVSIDGVLIKDGLVDSTDVSVSGTLSVNPAGIAQIGEIIESDTDAGVLIEAVLIKDGLVDGKDVSTLTSNAGDLVGPSSSTDNNIPRFDGTTGKLLQNGTNQPSIADNGGISIVDTGSNSPLLIATSGGLTLKISSDSITTAGGNDITINGQYGINFASSNGGINGNNLVTTGLRIQPRTGTTTSSATPTINTDNVDFYSLTAQAADITSFTTNLSGTPVNGQRLWIAITGTASRAIAWGSSFEASTVALPTTTSGTSRLDVGFVWNSVTSKWRCLAVA